MSYATKYSVLAIILVVAVSGCQQSLTMEFTEKQLTSTSQGHTIHHTQVFSKDGAWVVYDTRNDDTKIGSTGHIEMVHVATGEVKQLYAVPNQTEYGPGVGAATFSPAADRVIFIHGIRNADQLNPYGMTRRTGVAIDIDSPNYPIFMDARDITPPFTAGALRGGTHAHSWSGDGQWLSFTYNDWVIERLALSDSSVRDLRMVGVMIPGRVDVEEDMSHENHSGECFSVVVTHVVPNPSPGSDAIDKAFDECWIGTDGYLKPDGVWQHKAIAFQGNVRHASGKTVTEIFVVDLPNNLTTAVVDSPLEGTKISFPGVPYGIVQRRVTFMEKGVLGPRHWLRSTPDGSRVFFLSEDDEGIVQVYAVPTNGGSPVQLTHNVFDVQGQFNIHPDGKLMVYVADNSILVTSIEDGITRRITRRFDDEGKPIGAPSWSPDGSKIIYSRYVGNGENRFLQLFLLDYDFSLNSD